MTLVVDASAVVAALISDDAGAFVRRRLAAGDVLAAPHVLDVEVVSALRRLRHTVGERRAAEALTDHRRLRLVRYPHEPLLPDMWSLRDRFSAYGAAYVALARAIGAALLTLDQRLAGEARRHVTVETA